MASRTVIDCDHCKKQEIQKPPVPLHVRTDRRMDGAGSMENISETIDLCADCTTKALQVFLKDLSFENARAFFSKWGGKKCY